MSVFGILGIIFMAINAGLLGLLYSGHLKRSSKSEVTCYIAQPICGVIGLTFLVCGVCI